jgi:hypothetical protein
MELRLTIAIDDVNPKKGYRILGEQTETWLKKLNEDFGARFTLFIPSNYRKVYPLSGNKEWVQELASIEWLELAAHGHYHMTSDTQRFGECEFLELQDRHEVDNRFHSLLEEWESVDIIPVGWRNPGWLCSEMTNRWINEYYDNTEGMLFKYAAIHYEHNRGLEWTCKTFYGHDGIQMENISIHNGDMIMYQSHIAGTHNHNVWNEHNYEQLHLSLTHLFQSYKVTPKLLKECLT